MSQIFISVIISLAIVGLGQTQTFLNSNTEPIEDAGEFIDRNLKLSTKEHFPLVPAEQSKSNYENKSDEYRRNLLLNQRIILEFADDFVILKNQCLELAKTKQSLNINLDLFFSNRIVTFDLASQINECFNIFKAEIVGLNLGYGEIAENVIRSLIDNSFLSISFRLVRMTGLNIDAYNYIITKFNNLQLSLDLTNNITEDKANIDYFTDLIKRNQNIVKLTLFESEFPYSWFTDFICNSANNTKLRYLLLDSSEFNFSKEEENGIIGCLNTLYENRKGSKITIILPEKLATRKTILDLTNEKNLSKFQFVFVRFD